MNKNTPLSDPVANLYQPPYQQGRSPAAATPPPVSREEKREAVAKELAAMKPTDKSRQKDFIGLMSLSLASTLMVMALLLLICSKDGVLTLEWKSDHWYVYALSGLPLLYFGWRQLSALDSKN